MLFNETLLSLIELKKFFIIVSKTKNLSIECNLNIFQINYNLINSYSQSLNDPLSC